MLKALLILFFSHFSEAYIPKASHVLNKLVEHSGSGAYQVELDVLFTSQEPPIKLKETWYITDQNHMRLQVIGENGLALHYLFVDGKRFFKTSKGSFSKKTTDAFFEKFFHFRDSSEFLDLLVDTNILTPASYTKKNPRTDKDFEYKPEPSIRLGRTGGVVNYVFGSPNKAKIWIEQDQFVVRKLRGNSDYEISADDYSSFARGLLYPRVRMLKWSNNEIELKTNRVAAKAGFAKNFLLLAQLPISTEIETPTVNDFYSRFR